jgi:hypothetical protein
MYTGMVAIDFLFETVKTELLAVFLAYDKCLNIFSFLFLYFRQAVQIVISNQCPLEKTAMNSCESIYNAGQI